MELYGIEAFLIVFEARKRASGRVCNWYKTLRKLFHAVPMAHPCDAFTCYIAEQGRFGIEFCFRSSVLTAGQAIGRNHCSSEGVGHQLCPIAYPQHRYAEFEYSSVYFGGLFVIDAGRSSGEDYRYWIEVRYFVVRQGERFDFAVYTDLSHASGYELVVLTSEVQNQHFFFVGFHFVSVSELDCSVFR